MNTRMILIYKNTAHSVISTHRLETCHSFDWQDAKILDKETSYNKRLISEMIFIKKQNNGLNKQSDTDSLPNAYLPLLHNIK